MTLELCDNSKKDGILEYVGNEYYKCLYLYINLIKYGCQSDYTRVWEMKDGKETAMVMLSYHSALHLFSRGMEINPEKLAGIITDINPSIICASADMIRLLEPIMKEQGYISEYGHIGKYIHHTSVGMDYAIQLANIGDIEEIAKLLYEDEDIGASYSYEDLVKQMKERLSDGYVRSYIIKNGNQIVAHLGTGAETERLCTISYVITAVDYRGKGLSTALFSYACERLKGEGKEIYSVYYPEDSRRLHHKNGFEDWCEYGKLFRNIQ